MATKMTTRQSQLRQEVESLREENQRLDKLVQQQKAGANPAEKARTPRAKGSERQTPQDLGEAQREIAQLRGWIQQLQQEAQMAREELEAACQREGDTTECLLQCRTEKQSLESQVEWLTVQLDQCQAQKSTVERNMELLTGAACRSKKDCRRTSRPGRSGSAEASERACSTTRGSGTTTIQKPGGARRKMRGVDH